MDIRKTKPALRKRKNHNTTETHHPFTLIKELPTGKGYADLALIPYVPNIPAIIIELKNNRSAESAINQIKEKKYDDLLEHYRGEMLFVGINYDPDTKKHECKIGKFKVES